MKTFIINILFAFLLCLFQMAIIFLLPSPFFYWQLFLNALVVIVFLDKLKKFIVGIILGGVILNVYSFSFIFVIPLIFLVIAAIATAAFKIFFTNYSAYSLVILQFIVTVCYNFLLFLFIELISFISANFLALPINLFFEHLLWQLVFDTFFIFIIWLIFLRVHRVTERFTFIN